MTNLQLSLIIKAFLVVFDVRIFTDLAGHKWQILSTVTTDEMIHQSDEMIQYLSWPSKAADLICLWRLKLDFNEQYLSVNELTKSCPIFM